MPPFLPQDFYFKEARRLGYVARSAFKLLEIQQRHKVIGAGATVLDLGCAPGAWLQVACQALGPPAKHGAVIGVDIQEAKVPGNFCDARVRVIKKDAFALHPQFLRTCCPQGFSTVLSDMCPPTSGVGFKDVALSLHLAEQALQLAMGQPPTSATSALCHVIILPSVEGEGGGGGVLIGGGHFVVKLLEGAGIQGGVSIISVESCLSRGELWGQKLSSSMRGSGMLKGVKRE